MNLRSRVVVVALVVVAGATSVDAQGGRGTGRPQMPPGAPGRGGAMQRESLSQAEIQDQFDAYAIVQAQDALQLSDDQYPQFVRRMRALQGARRRRQVERNRLMTDLNHRIRQSADDVQMAAVVKAVDDHDRGTFEELHKAHAGVDEVLSPRQRARFRILEEQLERKKLDMLFRARQGARR
ncbi:MAG: hypothetical protein M3R55_09395 [Acidobacteriota bacterium]|nr:hypothetical protein [Acidobacteriota bacterium]